ncbi:MAG: zf-TFIIB domain-containing protein [Candidatus Gracilibacteria bacterium]
MNCPVCNVALVMSERQGVEIDYCPQCRGVWLDRGELDKIIEKSAQQPSYDAPRPQERTQPSHSQETYHKKPHKKESFFSELFDF